MRLSGNVIPNGERPIQAQHDGAVAISSQLPDTSQLEGTVAADVIEFVKCYLGFHDIGVAARGGPVAVDRHRNHRVGYLCRLDRKRGEIVGEWQTPCRGPLGRIVPPANRGAFELYREN